MNFLLKCAVVALSVFGLLAPATAQVSFAPMSLTASTTLADRHINAALVVNAAAGLTLTLPDATGSGKMFEIVIGTTVTSNNVIVQVANGNDVMAGYAIIGQDAGDTVAMFETASTSDTITLNGSTKGGIKGDRIVLKDVGNDLWHVEMIGSGTGTEVTPFSAAVS